MSNTMSSYLVAEIWQKQAQRIKFLEKQVRLANAVLGELSDDQLDNAIDRLWSVDTVQELRDKLKFVRDDGE
jgi:hypothetical protein